MKVLALARGYYDRRVREAGEAFSLSDPAHFSSAWMRDLAAGNVSDESQGSAQNNEKRRPERQSKEGKN